MTTVPCHYCQLPVRCRRVEPNQPVYCCSGCAIAAQIPVDANGQFPINKALVGALVLAFVYFNQALFTLLNGLLVHQGRLDVAARFGWLAMASAAVVWLTSLTIQISAAGAVRSRFDWPIWGGTLILPVAIGLAVGPSLTCMLLSNLILLLWGARGLLRRRRTGEK